VGALTAIRVVGTNLSSIHVPRVAALQSEESWLSFYYVAAAGFAYVDIMVAGSLLSDHQVATLGASFRYLAIVLAAVPALGAILRVRTAQADLIDSPAGQREMLIRWVRTGTVPVTILLGTTALLAPVLIPLIDNGRYPASIETFQILLATAFSAYLTAPAPSMLMAQRRYATLAVLYALGLLVNLAGDIVVAPRFGVVGIAIVSASTFVALDGAMLGLSLRATKRRHRC
jgi:O-antigen/teichoic acid export membrane protein